MNDDNWKHRSVSMKCDTCMWFVKKYKESGVLCTLDDDDNPIEVPFKEIGRCRRNAPTINGFPVVFTSDWCGNHKIDETKI